MEHIMRIHPSASPTFVFVHGFLGFHHLRLLGFTIEYFRKLEGELRQYGLSCLIPTLPATGTIEERASELAKQLARHGSDRFVLVGHSMGGLDSRYLTYHLDPDHRVECVVTLGTPHRGSALPRWLLSGDGRLQRFAQRRWRRPLEELTPEACQTFNAHVPNRADVRYSSYAGVRPFEELPVWMRPGARLVTSEEGENDGLTAMSSARWGTFRDSVRADHFELVGWSLGLPDKTTVRPFSHLDLYRRILTEEPTFGPDLSAKGHQVNNIPASSRR
jgi:triacylglycerol lipase